ncbi:MAG: PGN_0703 family putative restriction endonuclease [Dehalococcoidia bacterium]
MLGMEELKESIEVTKTTVECPVKGCSEKVERQRRVFKREERFKCSKHNVYISPSTFEYSTEVENLLWTSTDDRNLLDKIRLVKRECRMARDNSEDAVTWNVFRFLQRSNLLEMTLSFIIGIALKPSEVIYWSYSPKENSIWSELSRARKEFGEEIKRSSEPDIIIQTDNALLFIEAKLTAGNKTTPSDTSNSKKYETGGDNWFSKVFKADYKTVAIVEEKYELLRFWLLGTWIAKQLDLDFYLVNLVLSEREKEIEAIFKRHIYENQRRKFIRITWEDIYRQILNSGLSGIDKDTIIKYFRNKAIGYDRNGRLQRAFSMPIADDIR